jgi:hypothetical protein
MSLTCLDTLVGLSPSEVPCWTGTPPEGFDVSDSGYYLTDADFGLTIISGASVDGWGILTTALEQAKREFKTDLLATLRTRFDGSIKPFSGLVGEPRFTSTRSVSKDFSGIRIRVKRKRGACFVLKKIALGLDASGTKTVTVTSNDPNFDAPAPLTVSHTLNAFSEVAWPTEVVLPFWSDSVQTDFLEYYIAFDRDGAVPLNNKLTCCGKSAIWEKNFAATGFFADTNTPENTASFSSAAMGVSIRGYISCDNLGWLCEVRELNGYYLLDVVARAMQQRAAAIAASILIESPQISVGNGFNAQELANRRNYLNQAYSEKVKWIGENVPSGVTDCFTCKPSGKFKNSKLLV